MTLAPDIALHSDRTQIQPPAVSPGKLTDLFQLGLDAPICLTWELTYACNLSCVHCLSSSVDVTRESIVRAAAGNLKKVTLELGGKSPVIVFDDADHRAAIRRATHAIFQNAGQICAAGSRIYVQRDSYDEVI